MKFQHTFTALAICTAMLHITPAAASDLPDVLGIRTGLAISQAEEQIKKMHPEFQRKVIRNHIIRPYGFNYSKNPDERGTSQITLGIDSADRVWFVGQAQNFPLGDRPSLVSLEESLSQKYGKPSAAYYESNNPVDYVMEWYFNENRQLLSSAQANTYEQNPCRDQNGDNMSITNNIHLTIPRVTLPNCSMRVTAKFRVNPRSKLIWSFSTSVSNMAVLYADPTFGQPSRDNEEMRNKLNNEGKKKTQVPI